jgi:xanthine/uracil permease
VLVGFIGLTVVVARVVPPERSVVGFVAAMSGLSLALIAICWWKGEPPRWRWG